MDRGTPKYRYRVPSQKRTSSTFVSGSNDTWSMLVESKRTMIIKPENDHVLLANVWLESTVRSRPSAHGSDSHRAHRLAPCERLASCRPSVIYVRDAISGGSRSARVSDGAALPPGDRAIAAPDSRTCVVKIRHPKSRAAPEDEQRGLRPSTFLCQEPPDHGGASRTKPAGWRRNP